MTRILITGNGGFIGHHLTKRLASEGNFVRGADVKLPEYEETDAQEFYKVDLRDFSSCLAVTKDIDEVYTLAANMGGIGWITSHLADIARDNVLINVNMLEAARVNGVKKFLYTSSACVYNQQKQTDENVVPLKEEDAYPADPEPGYGWEKLFTEQLCEYYRKDFGLDVRVVRFHNVYGPLGTYDGGKEKSPAALCRKIALAEDGGELEIWGDGEQTRSYLYINECVEGLIRLMASDYTQPLNLGRAELTSINSLADRISEISGKNLSKHHDLTKPQGVRGRNSDNSRLCRVLGWEPELDLSGGLKRTYEWIAQELRTLDFYRQFISEGSLVFDIGANAGNKTKIFLDLNANIVAVEPQHFCIDYLKKRFDDKIIIVPKAVGDSVGTGKLTIGQNRGLSTLSPEWKAAIHGTNRFPGFKWSKSQDAEITTLDNMIAEYGSPDFIKIDVEGYESKVLNGLSKPVKTLCFEFHPEYLEDTARCLNRLNSLGMTEFNYSLEESSHFALAYWISGSDLMESLDSYRGNNKIYGDVYARLPA